MRKLLLITFLSIALSACATTSPGIVAELQQGKRYFEAGYYKKAMHQLLPLASDGNAQAQYAVGYMYYYGYGVTLDTEVGYFWMRKSAAQGYPPAVKALGIISANKSETGR